MKQYTTIVKIPAEHVTDEQAMAEYAGRTWLQRVYDLGWEPLRIGQSSHLRMNARYDPDSETQYVHVMGPVIQPSAKDDDD
jgi:hypothetical protein